MANGGPIGTKYFDGIPETNFGKGFLDPNLKIDELSALMDKTRKILGQSTTNYNNPEIIKDKEKLSKSNINYRPAPDLKQNPKTAGIDGGSPSFNFRDGDRQTSINTSNQHVAINTGRIIDPQDNFGWAVG